MKIVASKHPNNQQERLFRWQRKAVVLIQRQSEGRFLDNQQKRLVRRWQRWQSQKRAETLLGKVKVSNHSEALGEVAA